MMADVNKGFVFRWSFTLPKLEVYNIILAHFVFKYRTETLPGSYDSATLEGNFQLITIVTLSLSSFFCV